MDRRDFVKTAATVAAASAAAPLWMSGCARREHPDVYLIVVDSLRADHLGCYGYGKPVSPVIDAFAAQSILFEHCLAAAPWTTASVASLLSSQYPTSLGIRDKVVRFASRTTTLPQAMRDRGYRAEGVVSVDMLSHRLGFDVGFDAYDDTHYPGREGVTAPSVLRKGADLATAERDAPLFALLHTFDPHYNYILHDPRAAAGYDGPLRSNHPIVDLWGRLPELGDADRDFLLACYDSEIVFTDRHLGIFFDALKAADRYDDALIILTADHGEEFLERGWVGHSISVHREQVHVPLLVKLPGATTGARVAAPVSLLDVMPSLLRTLDLDASEGLDGVAHDWREPGAIPVRPVFSETFHAQRHRPGGMGRIALTSVRLGDRKLISDGVARDYAFYDLAADPDERAPLPPSRDEGDRALVDLLDRWRDRVEAKRAGAEVDDAETLLDPEQLKRLESLGYI